MNQKLQHDEPYYPYQCSNCRETFQTLLFLKLHREKECDISGSSQGSFRLRRTHSKNKLFSNFPSPEYFPTVQNSYPPNHITTSNTGSTPPVRNEVPRAKQEWKFLSGRVAPDVTATLYFAGKVNQGSLTGGCGWWVIDGTTVIAYGAAPVLQNFPSPIRLEYEGLLNGLQAAIRKGIRNLIIKGCSDLILTHFSTGIQQKLYWQTIVFSVKDLHQAIIRSFQQFLHYEFVLINHDDNYYADRLAEKAIFDHQQQNEAILSKKLSINEPGTENKTPYPVKSHVLKSSFDEIFNFTKTNQTVASVSHRSRAQVYRQLA